MPAGTKTHKIYEALMGKGHTKASAARIAQSMTHMSLMKDKPLKKKHKEGKAMKKKPKKPVGY